VSNEQIIEEILIEAHDLGLAKEVFYIFSKMSHPEDITSRYTIALERAKENFIEKRFKEGEEEFNF